MTNSISCVMHADCIADDVVDAISALSIGRPLLVRAWASSGCPIAVLSIETLNMQRLGIFKSLLKGHALSGSQVFSYSLYLSRNRARFLLESEYLPDDLRKDIKAQLDSNDVHGISLTVDSSDDSVVMRLSSWLANPLYELSYAEIHGSVRSIRCNTMDDVSDKTMELLRFSLQRLKGCERIPAFLYAPLNQEVKADFRVRELVIEDYNSVMQHKEWQKVEEVELNLEGCGCFKTHVFKDNIFRKEVFVLEAGNALRRGSSEAPLCRLHSECFTGDTLGSLGCDCRQQLWSALHQISSDSGGGVLLYLPHEGRGIGLMNKIRTYVLQQKRGMDTVDANHILGFEDDERDFSDAASILKYMGVDTVRLLTNNPAKMGCLTQHGIGVTCVPLRIDSNCHNDMYLRTKKERSQHNL